MILLAACGQADDWKTSPDPKRPYLVVLGVAQDAGYPQAACDKSCCQRAWTNPSYQRLVSCLGLVDPVSKSYWLLDATPDIREQMHQLESLDGDLSLAGIFLTHAHIGHYTGLMQFGREVMGASAVPVYAMPRMGQYLRENGPWSQLVDLNNIKLIGLRQDSVIRLGEELLVMPFVVPHRDEFSETVGYAIKSAGRSVLFIPDIDKWEKWDQDIRQLVQAYDLAFLDGSFFDAGELPGRNMNEIPHPFVVESLQLFEDLPAAERSKIHFIHFNHTNPLLITDGPAQQKLREAGYNQAVQGQIEPL